MKKNDKIFQSAQDYVKSKGLSMNDNVRTGKVDPKFAAKVADAYQNMHHAPNDPKVKASYDSMIQQTADQYKHLKAGGLKLSPIKQGQKNPYEGGSKELLNDLHNNNHMWYYPTEQGFGSGQAEHKDNPLLKPMGENVKGHNLVANDMFRIVHDYFGHGKSANTFGAKGEENAYREHKQMFTPKAHGALTSETRGQNSWVNFGPKGEQNRKDPANTTFAEQKTGLMPKFTQKMYKNEEGGGVFLTHYSKQQGLKSIDPKFKRTGVDEGKKHNQLSHDISFYYPHTDNVEPRVTTGAKSKYTVQLNENHKIYDPADDNSQHIKAAKQKNNNAFNMDVMISHLKENGYHGMVNNAAGVPVIAMFHPMDVHSEDSLGEPMKKSEDSRYPKDLPKFKRGDQVHLSNGEVNHKEPGKPVIDRTKKYQVHGTNKTGQHSHWVTPVGSTNHRMDGHFHRTDRMHHQEDVKKSEKNANDLMKGKNAKEQKQKAFGRTSQPSAKSPQRDKHMGHIKDFAQRRYGLNMKPSGGKVNVETGERRDVDAQVGVDKPDWRSGDLEAQANPDAMVHELGHLDIMPKKVGLENAQTYMDQQYSQVQKEHGYMKQKVTQGEIQPMGIEQLLRRRMGLPANRSVVPAEQDAPPRMAVDDDTLAGTRVQTGMKRTGETKHGDLIRQSRFVKPENRERVDKIDRKELVFDKAKGWVKPDVSTKQGLRQNINSVINIRAREKAKDPSRKDTDTLMRSEDGEKKD